MKFVIQLFGVGRLLIVMLLSKFLLRSFPPLAFSPSGFLFFFFFVKKKAKQKKKNLTKQKITVEPNIIY